MFRIVPSKAFFDLIPVEGGEGGQTGGRLLLPDLLLLKLKEVFVTDYLFEISIPIIKNVENELSFPMGYYEKYCSCFESPMTLEKTFTYLFP